MQAKTTKSFRIGEGDITRKYCAGEMITVEASAKWAVANGFGVEIDEDGDEVKAKTSPKNKAKAAPKNKAG